jgi:hypothetical protein
MSMAAHLGTHSAASLLPRGVGLLRDPLLNKELPSAKESATRWDYRASCRRTC